MSKYIAFWALFRNYMKLKDCSCISFIECSFYDNAPIFIILIYQGCTQLLPLFYLLNYVDPATEQFTICKAIYHDLLMTKSPSFNSGASFFQFETSVKWVVTCVINLKVKIIFPLLFSFYDTSSFSLHIHILIAFVRIH